MNHVYTGQHMIYEPLDDLLIQIYKILCVYVYTLQAYPYTLRTQNIYISLNKTHMNPYEIIL